MQYQIFMDDEEKSWMDYKGYCDSLGMIHGISIKDAEVGGARGRGQMGAGGRPGND